MLIKINKYDFIPANISQYQKEISKSDKKEVYLYKNDRLNSRLLSDKYRAGDKNNTCQMRGEK